MALRGIYHTWRARKDGSRTWYYYAWKGGPLVWKGAERLPEPIPPDHPVIPAWTAAQASRGEPAPLEIAPGFISSLVARYRAGPLQRLAPSTRQQWGRWLDRIEDHFGELELAGCDERAFRAEIVRWREQWASTPRQADYGVQVLSRLLSEAKAGGEIDYNRAAGIPRLYRGGQRAEIIWTDDQVAAVATHPDTHPCVSRAVRLAAATGLRRGDLAGLRWSEVGDAEIIRPTNKSRGAHVARVPLLPETRLLLDELRADRQAVTVLTAPGGRPWAPGWLTRQVRAACEAAGVDRRLHDLRGTYATRLAAAGFSDEEVADVMGWSARSVARLRRVYVSAGAVAEARVHRLETARRERSGNQSV